MRTARCMQNREDRRKETLEKKTMDANETQLETNPMKRENNNPKRLINFLMKYIAESLPCE